MYFSTLNSGCLYFARLILFFNDFFDEILQVLYDVFTICLRFVHDFFCFFYCLIFFGQLKQKIVTTQRFGQLKQKLLLLLNFLTLLKEKTVTTEIFGAVLSKNCCYC